MTKQMTMADLAVMVQKGFLEMNAKIDANAKAIAELQSDVQELRGELRELRTEFNAFRDESRKDHATIYRTNGELVTRFEHEQLKLRIQLLENQPA